MCFAGFTGWKRDQSTPTTCIWFFMQTITLKPFKSSQVRSAQLSVRLSVFLFVCLSLSVCLPPPSIMQEGEICLSACVCVGFFLFVFFYCSGEDFTLNCSISEEERTAKYIASSSNTRLSSSPDNTRLSTSTICHSHHSQKFPVNPPPSSLPLPPPPPCQVFLILCMCFIRRPGSYPFL